MLRRVVPIWWHESNERLDLLGVPKVRVDRLHDCQWIFEASLILECPRECQEDPLVSKFIFGPRWLSGRELLYQLSCPPQVIFVERTELKHSRISIVLTKASGFYERAGRQIALIESEQH